MRISLILFSSLILSHSAFAQVDPSSALLLNNGRTTTRESGLDSGRYTVRPKSEPTRVIAPRKQNATATTVTEADETVEAGASVMSGPGGSGVSADAGAGATSVITQTQPGTAKKTAPTGQPHAGPVTGPVAGPAYEVTNQENGFTDRYLPVDRRRNLLEISIAPSYVYSNSDSGYFYRRYSTSGPALSAEAKVWLRPEVAIHTGYLGTLSGSVNDSVNGSREVSATQQWFSAGFRSRKFFGQSALTPNLTFGLDYLEYQFRVPSDSNVRARLRSSGLQLSLEGEVPFSDRRAWTIGFSFAPKLQHKEVSTAIDYRSGGAIDANAVGLTLGGRIQFDRANAIFYKLSHIVEKDLFTGEATLPDPVTGLTPAGVAVTNSFTVLQIGYIWGN